MRGKPCIVLQALHVQFLWQHSAASDCNQERQPIAVPYTLQFLFFSAAAHVFFFKAEAGWKSGMATTVRGVGFSYGRQLYWNEFRGPVTTMPAQKRFTQPLSSAP